MLNFKEKAYLCTIIKIEIMAKKKQKNQQTGQQFLSPEKFMKQRARSLEIGTCFVSEDMHEYGEGYVIVTRRHTGGRISVAFYLIDIFCLGVKDSFYRLRLEEDELEEMLDRMPNIIKCSYEEAHNWVYGAIAWAEEAGIAPDKSFAVTKYMLEEDTDEVPLIEYEFGHNGKHWLMANNNLELSRYLPLLKKNLGEGNYTLTVKTDYEDADLSEEEILDKMENYKDSPLFKSYGPDTEYTYHHPDYPKTLQLDSPKWLYQELQDTKNAMYLTEELISRILALPHDTLRRDLEQMVLYHIGQTCDGIPDEYDPNGYTGIIPNCIILLGEVGNEKSSLDVVLETLRQSLEFRDYHFGDYGSEIIVPTLYLLGQNRLDALMNFIKEEGLETFFKCHVFSVVAYIAIAQPQRRNEVIEWFREAIRFATKMLPKTQWIDNVLAGRMLNDLIDIQAKELLPELREMFATELVDIGACGDFNKVSRMIANPYYEGNVSMYETNIYQRFENLKRYWDNIDGKK